MPIQRPRKLRFGLRIIEFGPVFNIRYDMLAQVEGEVEAEVVEVAVEVEVVEVEVEGKSL